MDEYARRLGRRIRELREREELTQADLASEMRALGVPGMHAQTVVKLEQGSRALKFQEGMALAAILGVNPERLGADWEKSKAELAVEGLANEVSARAREIAGAVELLYGARGELERSFERLQSVLPDTLAQHVRALLDSATLDTMVPHLHQHIYSDSDAPTLPSPPWMIDLGASPRSMTTQELREIPVLPSADQFMTDPRYAALEGEGDGE